MNHDFVPALLPVADALDRLGVAYYVGGSVASSVHGLARSTLDVDVVADLEPRHVAPFVALVGGAFYADEESISDAVGRRSSFNLIHDTGFKVDVFVARRDRYSRSSLARRIEETVAADVRSLPVATREDVVLAKLDWFRKGGEVSEQQWRDVQGVLEIQREAMDLAYLRRWAPELGVADLLEKALTQARLG